MNNKGQFFIPIYGSTWTLGLTGSIIGVIITTIISFNNNFQSIPFTFWFPIILITTSIGAYFDYKLFNREKFILYLNIGVFIVVCIAIYFMQKITENF